MRILITGGTGMIGTALTKSLLTDGHQVLILTRDPNKEHFLEGAGAVGWDAITSKGWDESVGQVDAVVNLVGERLSKWPWTKKQKSRFLDSRVAGGRTLAQAIRGASSRPQVLVQASGVNFYGPRGLTPVDELEAAGNDFLADLCRKWEASTEPVEKLGVRRVIIRSAIVLSAQDGILPIMLLPVRMFAGGRLGSGIQGLPWIHLQDEVAAIRFLMENPNASGVYNLTSPDPISSADFIRTMARSIQRPYWLPIPAFVLRLVLGGMATLVLDGAYVLPTRLQEAGFHFRFSSAEDALRDLLGKR